MLKYLPDEKNINNIVIENIEECEAEKRLETINAVLQKLKLEDDPVAWCADDFIAALAETYRDDRQEFERIYQKLKKHRIATDVKKAVQVFLKKEKFSNKPTQPTPSTLSRLSEVKNLHQTSTKHTPKLDYGVLVSVDDETGDPKLLIESEAALKIVEALRGCYAFGVATWYRFTGSHWQHVKGIDAELTRLLYIGTDGLGFKPHYKNGIRDIIETGELLPLPDIDGRHLLPFQNGLLDCRTKTLIPARPDNALTWCIPYDYNKNADCPTIKQWLLTAVDGDQETVDLLMAWLAALLHGRADLQKFLHLYGSGGTGKGTFIRLASALVGDCNAVSTTLKRMEGGQFETARYLDKRLIVITDSDKYGGSLDTFKAVTGQDALPVERKHQQAEADFVFGGLVLMASNERLMSTDHSSGIERRRITVTFDRRATDAEKRDWNQRGGEKTVLHSELPGLVNVLLKFSQEDIEQRIRTLPDRIQRDNFAAMLASNPVSEWLVNCCRHDLEEWTQIGTKVEIREPGEETAFEGHDTKLYPNYLLWSQRHQRSPLSHIRFTDTVIDTVKTFGFDVRKSRKSDGVGLYGVRLKKDWEDKEGDDNISHWFGSGAGSSVG